MINVISTVIALYSVDEERAPTSADTDSGVKICTGTRAGIDVYIGMLFQSNTCITSSIYVHITIRIDIYVCISIAKVISISIISYWTVITDASTDIHHRIF